MKTKDEILQDAVKTQPKESLTGHLKTINVLREKGYSWREVAAFLNERGVPTNHSKVFRFFQKNSRRETTMTQVPTKEEYKKALKAIRNSINENQMKMLRFHYNAPNRTVTFRQLAEEADFQDHGGANLWYGKLGKALGDEMAFQFPRDESRGEIFCAGSIGTGITQPKSADFHIMMHHSLADALGEMEWFK